MFFVRTAGLGRETLQFLYIYIYIYTYIWVGGVLFTKVPYSIGDPKERSYSGVRLSNPDRTEATYPRKAPVPPAGVAPSDTAARGEGEDSAAKGVAVMALRLMCL